MDELLPGDEVEVCHRAWVVSEEPTDYGYPMVTVRWPDGTKGIVPGFDVQPRKRIQEMIAAEAERDRLRAVIDLVIDYRKTLRTRVENVNTALATDWSVGRQLAEHRLAEDVRAKEAVMDAALDALDTRERT